MAAYGRSLGDCYCSPWVAFPLLCFTRPLRIMVPEQITLTYLNGLKRWRFWASKFPEITVLPATPAYVVLYLLSVLQASTSPSPVQSALYSILWAHNIAGLESPTSHTLPQKVLESARRRLSHQTSKNLPMTGEILLKFFF